MVIPMKTNARSVFGLIGKCSIQIARKIWLVIPMRPKRESEKAFLASSIVVLVLGFSSEVFAQNGMSGDITQRETIGVNNSSVQNEDVKTCDCKLSTSATIPFTYGGQYYGLYSEMECNAVKNATPDERKGLLFRKQRSSVNTPEVDCRPNRFLTVFTYNNNTGKCEGHTQITVTNEGCGKREDVKTCDCKLSTSATIPFTYGGQYYGLYSEMECNAVKNATPDERKGLLFRKQRSSVNTPEVDCRPNRFLTVFTYNNNTGKCEGHTQITVTNEGCGKR